MGLFGPGLAILIVVVPLATGARFIVRRKEYSAKLGFPDSLFANLVVAFSGCFLIALGIYIDYRMIYSAMVH